MKEVIKMQTIFGNLQFDMGWKTLYDITLFHRQYTITIKARAYFEDDGITDAQITAFSDFKGHQEEKEKRIEDLLVSFEPDSAPDRFKPRTLLFERDGGYALLCDDVCDLDGGIAVTLSPEQCVVSQDDYL